MVPRLWKFIQKVREKFTRRCCDAISQPSAAYQATSCGFRRHQDGQRGSSEATESAMSSFLHLAAGSDRPVEGGAKAHRQPPPVADAAPPDVAS